MTEHKLNNTPKCNQPNLLLDISIRQKEEVKLEEGKWEEKEDKEVGVLIEVHQA